MTVTQSSLLYLTALDLQTASFLKTPKLKAAKRTYRECGEKSIINGTNTTKPANWKEALTHYESKLQLMQVLQNEWSKDSFAEQLKEPTKDHIDRKVILMCEGNAYQLHSDGGNNNPHKKKQTVD